MRIIAFIEDEQLVKKILKSAGDGSNANRLREPMWNIRLWRRPPTEAFIIYDESSLPSSDDPALLLILRRTGAISLMMLRRTGYLIDADRTTPRLSTGGSRREALDRLSDGNLPLKKSSPGQNHELCSNWA
jgi:hypothetical protein